MTRKSFYIRKLKQVADINSLTSLDWLELAEARAKETGKIASKKATEEFSQHLLERIREEERLKKAAIRYHKRHIMKDFEQLTKERS